MALIAYTIHTLGAFALRLWSPVVPAPMPDLLGPVPEPPVPDTPEPPEPPEPVLTPAGAAETREAAENAIAMKEMRERRMIVSRTSLIRIRDGYLTTHGLFKGMTGKI